MPAIGLEWFPKLFYKKDLRPLPQRQKQMWRIGNINLRMTIRSWETFPRRANLARGWCDQRLSRKLSWIG
jgi:hypothetical protein